MNNDIDGEEYKLAGNTYEEVFIIHGQCGAQEQILTLSDGLAWAQKHADDGC